MRSLITPLIAFLLMAATSFAAVNVVSTVNRSKKTQTWVVDQKPAAALLVAVKKTTPAEASVPVTVTRGQYVSRCSGTAIGENTVLTCAHIFSEPGGVIKVDGHDAAVYRIDHESDLALLTVRNKIPFIEFASAGPAKGEQVTAYGFERGRNGLWRFPTQITNVNRYNGPANLSIAGVPQPGRSGGGLFNAAGELIGVCGAADHQDGEGFYTGHAAIKSLIDGKKTIVAVSNQGFLDNCPNGQCFAKPVAATCSNGQCQRPAVMAAPAATCECRNCQCAQQAVATKRVQHYASNQRGTRSRPVRGMFGRVFQRGRSFGAFRSRSCCS